MTGLEITFFFFFKSLYKAGETNISELKRKRRAYINVETCYQLQVLYFSLWEERKAVTSFLIFMYVNRHLIIYYDIFKTKLRYKDAT